MKELKKFTVDRSKWRCGGIYGAAAKGLGATRLLNDEGYMCCLGFVTWQLLPYVQILGISEPRKIDVQYMLNDNTELSEDAMHINDNSFLTYEERERLLTKLFKRHGYELEFVGEYNTKQ